MICSSRTLIIFILSLLFFVQGCGGGTSGSGLNIYEGKVQTTTGLALSKVKVTIESTGDTTSTNDKGEFSLESEAAGLEVPFLLESDLFSSRFILEGASETEKRVNMKITVDTDSDTVSVERFAMRAAFVGGCDHYFENTNPIRQANKVPDNTVCTIKVYVYGDEKPLGNIPIALQYASCSKNATWETLETSTTGVGKNRGIGQMSFSYKSSPEFCRYRVVAPFHLATYHPLFHYIKTFEEQESSQ